MVKPLHIKNAKIWTENNSEQRDLYCTDVILDQPALDSLVVDLEGYTIFPGLINAHDHLELNHYPRTKFREVYNNAHEWGEDVNARLDTEPYKSLRRYPIWDRLFIGGLKNLLCGATTVAHHGPKYKELYRKDFPVRVIKNYGWSHSLHFDNEEDIVKSYQSTPKNHPWFIHLAEGTDEVAQGEYQRLEMLNCFSFNTVLVHGVGISADDVVNAHIYDFETGLGPCLIWCPSTNLYLLGKTAEVDHWDVVHVGNVALGSDSRLTADGNLLDELQCAYKIYHWSYNWIIDMVLGGAAHTLQLDNVGRLSPNNHADCIVVEKSLLPHKNETFPHSLRAMLKLIVKGGIPQIGDPDIMAQFPHIETVSALLDGVPKSVNIRLARQIQACKLKEPGLELVEMPRKRFWIF